MKDTKIISKFGYKNLIIAATFLLLAFIFDFCEFLFFIIFIFVLIVYRNPEREIASFDNDAILSPIDGKIENIEKVNHENKEFVKIVISNTVFNSGGIRSVCNMDIKDIKIIHGLFLCSYMNQSEVLNERLILQCHNKNNEFKFIIIPGALSRKIHFDTAQFLNTGKRFGFIVDGKVILIFPQNIRLQVGVGDKISACDLIGFFNNKKVV